MVEKKLSDQQVPDLFTRLCVAIESFPVPIGGVVIAMLITPVVVPNKQQQQQSIVFLVAALIVGLTAYLYYDSRRYRQSTKSDSSTSTSASTDGAKKSSLGAPTATATSTRLKRIWEAGKSAGTTKKGKDHTDKPFGSKYYYAHNNPNATGGYKDGLKMEDYQMNGPRLLSKNGQTTSDLKEDVPENDDGTDKEQTLAPPRNVSSITPIFTAQYPNAKRITKYLWDDPGDSNGIATIRIEVLPGNIGGDYIDCKDVQIGDIEARLAGEGLLVTFDATHSGSTNKYQLKIEKLFGDAADVKVVVKPKRLLVKIIKKRNSVLAWNKKESNLDEWPQPHRTV